MTTVRRRTVQEVLTLQQEILRDMESIQAYTPTTFKEWRDQLDQMDAWLAVTLGNVADLLPVEVRKLLLRIQEVRDAVLYRDPASLY